MRPYPRNSPEAAARIIALALLADGNVTQEELQVLARQDGTRRLGLGNAGLTAVLRDLCEDLLCGAHLSWSEACQIDRRTLAALMAEVDDPALRRTVLRLALEVIDADGEVADGESIVLAALAEHWHLQTDLFDAVFHLRASTPC